MSTTEDAFGLPAATLARWRDEFRLTEIPSSGASYVCLTTGRWCRAALCATKFLLAELDGINTKISAGRSNTQSLFIYAPRGAVGWERFHENAGQDQGELGLGNGQSKNMPIHCIAVLREVAVGS